MSCPLQRHSRLVRVSGDCFIYILSGSEFRMPASMSSLSHPAASDLWALGEKEYRAHSRQTAQDYGVSDPFPRSEVPHSGTSSPTLGAAQEPPG